MTNSMIGLKNGHVRKNLTQIGEPQRYNLDTEKKNKKKKNHGASHTRDARLYHKDIEMVHQ